MARIQVLELPMEHVGEYSKTPYALVIDQVGTVEEWSDIESLKKTSGAEFVLISVNTVDVA